MTVRHRKPPARLILDMSSKSAAYAYTRTRLRVAYQATASTPPPSFKAAFSTFFADDGDSDMFGKMRRKF